MTGDRPVGEDDLHAYVDGTLPSERRSTVDTYLAANAAAAAQVAAYARHRDALRERLQAKAGEPIPARLRIANLIAGRRRGPERLWPLPAVAAACLAAGIGIGAFGSAWMASRGPVPARGSQAVARDAITAYRTYVVETAHPVEVGASQETHLVQWLSRRLGKPIRAPDLTAQGYHLVGGRLLPAESAPAALLMYEDAGGSRLTVYARPGGRDEPTAFRFESQGDVSAFSWIDPDLSYVVTGRTDRETLLALAEAIYRQVEDRPPVGKNSL